MEKDYNNYYGDDESMRDENSRRGIVKKPPDSKSDSSYAKMMKCHCLTAVIMVMTIVLCSAVVVVLIKGPLGFQSTKEEAPVKNERDLPRRLFNEACDIGWIDGNLVQIGCLLFGNDTMNWTQAAAFCEKKNSRLVEIHDTTQKMFITSYIKIINAINNATISWWTGGTDNGKEDWLWAQSRLPIQDFVWAPGHPIINDKISSVCLSSGKSSKLYAYGCGSNTSSLKPICQNDQVQ